MKPRGLTLLEVMMALAVLAIVATLALPSFGAAAERARLRSAAETLAADLAEARFEATQRGSALHVEIAGGPGWCWAVATEPGCPCGEARACQLKAERAADHAGIELLDPRAAHLEPSGLGAPDGGAGAGALFRSSHGEALKVELSALGRARICAPQGALPGYPAC